MKRYILLGCGFFLLLKIASAYAAVGDITTVGGTGVGGPGALIVSLASDLRGSQLNYPASVLAYQYGLYIVDTDSNRVLRTSNKGGGSNQAVEPVAGETGKSGFSGGKGSSAVDAELKAPSGIALDDKGNLYIADSGNHVIRKVDVDGKITTVAGDAVDGLQGDGLPDGSGDDGAATKVRLNFPAGVAVDKTGNFLYIADRNNHKIRKVDINAGTISTFAGVKHTEGGVTFGGDSGRATEAYLFYPTSVMVHNDVVYIVDSENHRIREVTSGIINTTAGNGTPANTGNNGPAISASLNFPLDIAVDGEGNLFIADSGNHMIRKVNATTKNITTIAGIATLTGGFSGNNGPATAAELNMPAGVTIDRDGNLYIADTNNYRVRKVEGVAAPTTPPTGNNFALTLTAPTNGVVTSQPTGINCGTSMTSCSGTFSASSIVALTATPDTGATFTSWGGDCTGTTNPLNVTMDAARTCTATFTPAAAATQTLTVTKTGNGSISSNPVGISSGVDCSKAFTQGASVVLTATPDQGSTFTSWSGACSGSTVSVTLPMDAAKSCSATFTSTSSGTWNTAAAGTGLNVQGSRINTLSKFAASLPTTIVRSQPFELSVNFQLAADDVGKQLDLLLVVGIEPFKAQYTGVTRYTGIEVNYFAVIPEIAVCPGGFATSGGYCEVNLYATPDVWMAQLSEPYEKGVIAESNMVRTLTRSFPTLGMHYIFAGYRRPDNAIIYSAQPIAQFEVK